MFYPLNSEKVKKNRAHEDGKEVFDGSFCDKEGRRESCMPKIVGVGLTFVSKNWFLVFYCIVNWRIFILACFVLIPGTSYFANLHKVYDS